MDECKDNHITQVVKKCCLYVCECPCDFNRKYTYSSYASIGGVNSHKGNPLQAPRANHTSARPTAFPPTGIGYFLGLVCSHALFTYFCHTNPLTNLSVNICFVLQCIPNMFTKISRFLMHSWQGRVYLCSRSDKSFEKPKL